MARLLEHSEGGVGGEQKEEVKDKREQSSTSSSGPAAPQGGGPRSRGGVPMSADSGDSMPETVKRKIGDSEQGYSEESKGKKNTTGKEE